MAGCGGKLKEANRLATGKGVRSGIHQEEAASVVVMVLRAGAPGHEGTVERIELGVQFSSELRY